MSERFIAAGVTILIGIVGVAVIAVLMSRQSNTTGLIQAGSQGFAQDLLCALSPITGGSCGGFGLTPSVNSTITFGNGITPGIGGL